MDTLTGLKTALGRRLLGEEGVARGSRYHSEAAGWDLVTDDLVTSKAAGTGIYTEMRDDPDVKAALTVKSAGVLSRGWQLQPSPTAPADSGAEDQAAFVQGVFDSMPGSIDDILEEILIDTLAYGTSVVELVWAANDGKWVYANIKPKDPTLYKVRLDDFNNITAITLRVDGGDVHVDPNKFRIFAYNASHGDPWGRSDLRGAYRYYWAKKKLFQWWLVWLEKYGMPTAIGRYRPGMGKSQQDDLLTVLDRIKTETAITIPTDVEVELLTANQMISSGGYGDALEWCGKQIVRSILGQTLTSDEGTRVGSMALGRVHQDVLSLYIKKLKRKVEEYVDEQWIRPLVDLNFATPLYPDFSLMIDDRDVASLSEVIWRLASVEVVDPRETWIREYLGLPAREELTPLITDEAFE